MERIAVALKTAGYPDPEFIRSNPITTVTHNFDRLYFPLDSLSRHPRYTRYLTDNQLLRTHTTCLIPELLQQLQGESVHQLWMLPGICYRRDVVDKRHVGEPHQMDIWMVSNQQHFDRQHLLSLIAIILSAVLPKWEYRLNEVDHPYTVRGLEIEVKQGNRWIEVGECGEAHPQLFIDSRLIGYSGLASGFGLDRLVMLMKDMDDIRLLRSSHPAIAAQMQNLDPYRPVSRQPAIARDMSIVVNPDIELEDICEVIQTALAIDVELLESVEILSETVYEALPIPAVQRLGIQPGQRNLLLRMTLRSLHASIGNRYADRLREQVYQALDLNLH